MAADRALQDGSAMICLLPDGRSDASWSGAGARDTDHFRSLAHLSNVAVDTMLAKPEGNVKEREAIVETLYVSLRNGRGSKVVNALFDYSLQGMRDVQDLRLRPASDKA